VLLACQTKPPATRLTAVIELLLAAVIDADAADPGSSGDDAHALKVEDTPRVGVVIIIAENICFISANPAVRSC
jgi:hypothetical protein